MPDSLSRKRGRGAPDFFKEKNMGRNTLLCDTLETATEQCPPGYFVPAAARMSGWQIS